MKSEQKFRTDVRFLKLPYCLKCSNTSCLFNLYGKILFLVLANFSIIFTLFHWLYLIWWSKYRKCRPIDIWKYKNYWFLIVWLFQGTSRNFWGFKINLTFWTSDFAKIENSISFLPFLILLLKICQIQNFFFKNLPS